LEEEYPGIYSFMGVKAIKRMVPAMRIPENIPPKRNTFNRDNLNENRSSKVFSFNRTNRYLSVSLCFNLRFFCLLSANVSCYSFANIQRMGYCNEMIKSLCWRVYFYLLLCFFAGLVILFLMLR
jgi:hypothetical protein